VFVDTLGDLNRDGQVTTADIPAMISAMADTQDYLTTKDLTSQQWTQLADINHDGVVNNADLQSLISMVANDASIVDAQNQVAMAIVPEPDSLVLATLGLMALLALGKPARLSHFPRIRFRGRGPARKYPTVPLRLRQEYQSSSAHLPDGNSRTELPHQRTCNSP
jgi:hypothetical protein